MFVPTQLVNFSVVPGHYRLVVVGVVPDQMGQVLWMTRGVTLAQQGDLAAYSQFEAMVFLWIMW